MKVQTGSGPGHIHHYYRQPVNCPIHRLCISGDFDIMTNGYVVAPGSVTTGEYTLLTPMRRVEDLPEAPAWAVDKLIEAVEKEAAKPAPAAPPSAPLSFSDQDIIDRCSRAKNGATFDRLYAGDITAHGGVDQSHSAADLALLSHFTFYTQDEGQLDTLYLSSGLARPEKWHSTYRTATLKRALSRTAFYEPPVSRGTEPTINIPNANGKYHGDGTGDIPPADPPVENVDTPREPRTFSLTDTGNAERLVALHGPVIRFNWGRDVWHVWSGRHWEEDRTGRMEQIAKATARSIPDEATALTGEQYTKTLKWAASSESSGKRQAMVDLARSEDNIPVQPHELDADPWLLNVANGTLNLRDGTLRAHRQDDLITRLIDVPYDPEATCPLFLAFLMRIFDNDEDLIGYVQRLVGYSLTGSTREQIMAIAYGTGSNGKTTLLGTVRGLLGNYGQEADADSFMERRHEGIREDIADLDGARFVAASETADGKRLSEALVKKMTGGELLRARRLYENGYTFAPQFKVWLSTNHRPEIRGTEYAIWRRIRLVPFTVTIGDAEKDADLPGKLAAEYPGILTWAVRGCMDWQRNGLNEPAAVMRATASYREDMDPLASWFADRCIVQRGIRTEHKLLHDDFVAYCENAGDEPVGARTFSDKLSERGHDVVRSNGKRYRKGLRLRTGPDDREQTTFDSAASAASAANSGNFSSNTSYAGFPGNTDTYDTYDTVDEEDDDDPTF